MNKQVNITMPESWLSQLERLARIYSVEDDRTITHLDLIRDALKEKYHLVDEEEIHTTPPVYPDSGLTAYGRKLKKDGEQEENEKREV